MAIAAKLVPPQSSPLDPRVKSWIDNVIVPILVREYLASEKQSAESFNRYTPMVTYPDDNSSAEGK